jgi:hypothetical protein
MAKVIARPPADDLYENDLALWAQRQAAVLRARRFDELDLENLIEHLLKLAFSHADRPRRGWLVTVDKQRARLARKLTTTLRNHLEAELPAVYAGLRRPVARQLEKDGLHLDALPAVCPCTLDQILDPDWYPADVRGRED